MKILHICPIRSTHSATGINQCILGLAPAQAAIGLKVGLLPSLPTPRGELVEKLPGVCVLENSCKPHYNPWLISRDWIVRIREEFGTPDLVTFHSVYVPFQTALARRCRRVGWLYIVTPHGGMTYLAQNQRGAKKRIANLLFFRSHVEHATAIHALTAREAEQIQALFEVEKIITVPNGVEDYLLEAPDKLTQADLGDFGRTGDLILGFAGRIDVYHKGLDLLLKAMAILKSRSDRLRCKLFVVGPFHRKKDERSFCLAMKSLGLKDDVRLLGPKYGEEKLRYFLACDVFVHTSRFEGMPMAVLEAMALGRPCLVTPGTNVAEMVREGGGWECEPNPESIAAVLKAIYEKRDSLEALGQRSRELVRTRFTWRKIAQQLGEQYDKIVEQDNSS